MFPEELELEELEDGVPASVPDPLGDFLLLADPREPESVATYTSEIKTRC